MSYSTSRFGTITVDPKDEIRLLRGLYGFDDLTRYALLPHNVPNSPFCWLQSLDRPELAFVLCSPKSFVSDYDPQLNDQIRGELKFDQGDSIVIFNLVTFKDGGHTAYANLCAPFILNVSKRVAAQFILNDKDYPVRHTLFETQTAQNNK